MRVVAILAGLALAATSLHAQERTSITDMGPGAGGPILRDILAKPHRLVPPDSARFVLRRGEEEEASLVVLGRDAAISGRVGGDVIVVGGDLFIRPGARITGRAVAIGGGVYSTPLAAVGRGTQSFYDYTYEVFRTTDGYRLEYRSLRAGQSAWLTFPGFYGVRVPEYDRVNGASLGFGPALSFARGNGEVNGVATYRSDLGEADPLLAATLRINPGLRAEARAERGTFTNESWIWGTFVNSMSALATGTDTRNYYRADRADVFIYRAWQPPRTKFEPFIGGRVERAWSVGPGFGATSGPWSLFGRTDSLGMRRPNPLVTDGTISSILTGGALSWESDGVELVARSQVELARGSPGLGEFTQIVSDFDVGFPTFSDQEYSIEVHWVTTPSAATPPPQRFHYVGGSGTLSFLDLLAQGGDELLFIDQRYLIPVSRVRLGFLGNPVVQLRHKLGSAGVGDLPSFEQTISIALAVSVFRGEVRMNPASGSVELGGGLSFTR